MHRYDRRNKSVGNSIKDQKMITLYDIGPIFIEGKEIGTSPFVRRIMYTLNYKKLPYKLKLLSYEAIEPTAKSIGAPPTGVRADGVTPR
ncbi:hypothetical protein MPER_05149, partial [Moniliophthora perniciosa FA553]